MIVRATVNLPGLQRGKMAETDPEVPYIARCLAAGYLVEVDTEGERVMPPQTPDQDVPGE